MKQQTDVSEHRRKVSRTGIIQGVNQPRDEMKRWVRVKRKRSFSKFPKTKKLIDEFFTWGNKRGGEFSKFSIQVYTTDFDEFFGYVKKEFTRVVEKDVRNYYQYLKEKGLSTSAITRMILAVKGLFRYAKDSKMIKENPVNIKFNQNESRNKFLEVSKQILTRDEIGKLLSAIRNPRDHCMIAMLYGLGLRISELTSLEVLDIDFDTNKIIIDGKGNKKRINDLKPSLVRRLREWLLVRGGQKTNYMFVTNYGNKMPDDYVRQLLKEMCNKLEFKKSITPHSLRHTFITHAIEDGIPLPELAKIVGHNDINMTMRYCQLAQMKNSYLEKFRDF